MNDFWSYAQKLWEMSVFICWNMNWFWRPTVFRLRIVIHSACTFLQVLITFSYSSDASAVMGVVTYFSCDVELSSLQSFYFVQMNKNMKTYSLLNRNKQSQTSLILSTCWWLEVGNFPIWLPLVSPLSDRLSYLKWRFETCKIALTAMLEFLWTNKDSP